MELKDRKVCALVNFAFTNLWKKMRQWWCQMTFIVRLIFVCKLWFVWYHIARPFLYFSFHNSVMQMFSSFLFKPPLTFNYVTITSHNLAQFWRFDPTIWAKNTCAFSVFLWKFPNKKLLSLAWKWKKIATVWPI